MKAFIVENSEFIGSEYALCPLNHISHGFAVVLVSYLVIYGNVVLRINCCLHIVCYFSDITTEQYLPALRIRRSRFGFLRILSAAFQDFVIVFSLLMLLDLILYNLLIIPVIFGQCPGIFLKLVIYVN